MNSFDLDLTHSSRVRIGENARDLVRLFVEAEDRVLILGASGWFGRTTVALFEGSGASLKSVGSHPRQLQVGTQLIPIERWNKKSIQDFNPTIVIDCAFLTHHKSVDMGLTQFIEMNRELTDRFVYAAGLPDVRQSMTISSGAALYPVDALSRPLEDNPYGYLKREAEHKIQSALSGAESLVIARAWSVTGGYMTNPRKYAVGSMILQAVEGKIQLTSDREVWRRYCLAEELIAVSLATQGSGITEIESGGDLIELHSLAEKVREIVNADAIIERPRVLGEANQYHSDGNSWNLACESVDFQTATLEEQLQLTAAGLI